MKVILDANVFVSAAIRKGPSHRLVDEWLSGVARFEIVLCPALVAEIRSVLTTRPRLRKWISLDDARVFVDTVASAVDLVDDPEQIIALTRDAKDDYLVALARQHDVQVIVTGDKDLLEWSEQEPPVVNPAEFEARLNDR